MLANNSNSSSSNSSPRHKTTTTTLLNLGNRNNNSSSSSSKEVPKWFSFSSPNIQDESQIEVPKQSAKKMSTELNLTLEY